MHLCKRRKLLIKNILCHFFIQLSGVKPKPFMKKKAAACKHFICINQLQLPRGRYQSNLPHPTLCELAYGTSYQYLTFNVLYIQSLKNYAFHLFYSRLIDKKACIICCQLFQHFLILFFHHRGLHNTRQQKIYFNTPCMPIFTVI